MKLKSVKVREVYRYWTWQLVEDRCRPCEGVQLLRPATISAERMRRQQDDAQRVLLREVAGQANVRTRSTGGRETLQIYAERWSTEKLRVARVACRTETALRAK